MGLADLLLSTAHASPILTMERINAKAAGYMELANAQKDGDCRKVQVFGGVSRELGCCNKFEPESEGVQEFRCGECEYLIHSKQAQNALAERSRVPRAV